MTLLAVVGGVLDGQKHAVNAMQRVGHLIHIRERPRMMLPVGPLREVPLTVPAAPAHVYEIALLRICEPEGDTAIRYLRPAGWTDHQSICHLFENYGTRK